MALQTTTPEKYEPAKYYIDIETTPCYLDNQREHNINHTEEVIIGSEQGTTFPTRVGTTVCNALIDTGATSCCMSEEYYEKLQLQKSTCYKMLVSDQPQGDISFNFDFIVCKNLTRPLILG